MAEIIPAVMPQDTRDIEAAVTRYIDTDVKTIQLDLMDGDFSPAKTWPYKSKNQYKDYKLLQEEGFPGWEDIDIELDLMIANPLKDMVNFIEYGPSRIIVHASSVSKDEYLEFLQTHNSSRSFIHFGLAFSIGDTVADYRELLDVVDFVQCMGIESIGKQGEPFDDRVFVLIKEVQKIKSDMPISVDGGVGPESAAKLIKAGASRLVSGSFLASSYDIPQSIEDLGGTDVEEI